MDVQQDSAALASHQATSRNYVKFYPKWVRNNFLSKQEGKEIGEYRDYLMVICPGQPKSEVHREVKEQDKREYAGEWNAYKAGKEQRISGTPIELLPGLDKGRADSLKTVYIYTIEQLAEASEPAMRAIGMGAMELVNRAKAYMQKNTAEVSALKAENQELRGMLETLRAQVEALGKPNKGGRPRKSQPSPVGPQ
jgi:hypothetical protein